MKKGSLYLGCIVVLVAGLGVGTASANSLAVTSTAPIEGTYSLNITMEGDAVATYVATDSPVDETGVSVEFKVKPYLLNLPAGQNVRIAKFLGFPKPVNASSPEHVIVFFKKSFDGSNFRIRVMAQQNFGFFSTCWEGYMQINAALVKTMKVDWVQGTGPQGSQDGRCSVYMDGTLMGQKTNLNTSEFDVDEVRIGGFQPSSAAATSGTYQLDSVVITRIP